MSIPEQLSRNRRVYGRLATASATRETPLPLLPRALATAPQTAAKRPAPPAAQPSAGREPVSPIQRREPETHTLGPIRQPERVEATPRRASLPPGEAPAPSQAEDKTAAIRFPISDAADDRPPEPDPVEGLFLRLEQEARTGSQLAGEEEFS